jgi:hypothetical protein
MLTCEQDVTGIELLIVDPITVVVEDVWIVVVPDIIGFTVVVIFAFFTKGRNLKPVYRYAAMITTMIATTYAKSPLCMDAPDL